jgi:hypothetical protein
VGGSIPRKKMPWVTSLVIARSGIEI